VLLADETTGNRDTSTAEDIMSLLTGLCEKTEVTFLLVTHDESLADRIGSRKLRMEDGVLVGS
jgi:lipoprotein-releasing system ATP-binding protein